MKNNWSKKIAKEYIKKYKKLGFSSDLALRVYSTRLLGRNKELVLHGGGNTSVKTNIKDIDGRNYKVGDRVWLSKEEEDTDDDEGEEDGGPAHNSQVGVIR